MKLELVRVALLSQSTLGVLRVDGAFECFVLEDRYRAPGEPKVPGKTCIPCGTYPVAITHSPRFGVEMPLVMNVPNFQGIRIHPGNTADDTEGCLLPGRSVNGADVIGGSRQAYAALFERLKAATGPISITITLA